MKMKRSLLHSFYNKFSFVAIVGTLPSIIGVKTLWEVDYGKEN